MLKKSFILLVGAAIAACSPDDTVLRSDGLGAVKLGMTVQDAEAALDTKVLSFKDSGFSDTACWKTRRADGREPYVFYMIEGTKIVRIDIAPTEDGLPPPIASDKGIKVGAQEQMVAAQYGPELKTTPHPYLGAGGNDMEVFDLLFSTQSFPVSFG